MQLIELINNIIEISKNNTTCNQALFGDIRLYDDMEVLYPLINIDIVKSKVTNNCKTYTFRIYAIDKNINPYIAYNKCELLLNQILGECEIYNFLINYFDLDYKDQVSGTYTDIQYSIKMNTECL